MIDVSLITELGEFTHAFTCVGVVVMVKLNNSN
jgi:hypothetical protein